MYQDPNNDYPIDLSRKAGPNPRGDYPPLNTTQQQTGPGRSPYTPIVQPPPPANNVGGRHPLLPAPQPSGTIWYGPTQAIPQQPYHGHRYHDNGAYTHRRNNNNQQRADTENTRQWKGWKSPNADFGRLVYLLINYLSIQQHLRNWASVPVTISTNIKRLLDAINLPGAKPDALRAVENDWKESLRKAARQQLLDQEVQVVRTLYAISAVNLEEALKVAARRFRAKCGNKYREQASQKDIDYIREVLSRQQRARAEKAAPKTGTIAPPTPSHSETENMEVTAAGNKKRERVEDTPSPPKQQGQTTKVHTKVPRRGPVDSDVEPDSEEELETPTRPAKITTKTGKVASNPTHVVRKATKEPTEVTYVLMSDEEEEGVFATPTGPTRKSGPQSRRALQGNTTKVSKSLTRIESTKSGKEEQQGKCRKDDQPTATPSSEDEEYEELGINLERILNDLREDGKTETGHL